MGAFAEYLVVDEELVLKVPDNGAMEMDEASTLGMSFLTALGALGRWLGLNLDPESTTGATTVEENETKTESNGNSENSNGFEFEPRTPILVWGGSTAVGHYVIQLLRLAGGGKRFTVITTGSRASIPRLQKLGADIVLAREDGVEENLKEIKRASSLAGDRGLTKALDCFSSKESAAACARALSSSPGEGRLHTLFPVELPEYAREGVCKTFGLVQTSLGPEYADMSVLDWMNPRPTKEEMREDHAFAARWYGFDRGVAYGLLRDKKLQPMPICRWEGGLAGIQGGIDAMREGKAAGLKIVHQIAEERE